MMFDVCDKLTMCFRDYKFSSTGFALCAMPHCFDKLTSSTDYCDHLCKNHAFPRSYLLETYSIAYYLIDSSLDRSDYSKVCDICQKDSTSLKQNATLPSSDDALSHIIAHMGLPRFHCTFCQTFFKTSSEASQHIDDNHIGQNFTVSIKQYFGDDVKGFQAWLKATNTLSKQLNLCIERHNFRWPKSLISKRTPEEQNFINFIKMYETELHSIGVFRGKSSQVFRLIGDWMLIGKLIQSASVADVKSCCQEIKHEFADLILHHRACHSMASLLLGCDNSSWNDLLTTLRKTDIVKQMYNSIDAATFFRKLMTSESLENYRFKNLSVVFATYNWVDPDLIESSQSGIFLFSIAARPGPAAIGFCKYAATNVSVFNVMF